jgi:signal transduction histidine kinase
VAGKIETKPKQEFRFSVDGALLSELGEKLVSSVHVALSELVKNAYDADADEVTVMVSPVVGQGPRIVVVDDGVGMTKEKVSAFWMRIGTTNKQDEPHSPVYGRRQSGSKGVGRFACRRLGKHLKLTTIAKIQKSKSSAIYEKTEVSFDWDTFQKGDVVESVPCVGTVSQSPTDKVGTKLEIWGAETDEWGTKGHDYLRRQLSLLATNRGGKKSGYKADPGFNIKLRIEGESDSLIEDIRESVIDASWGTLEAHVDNKGIAHCSLVAKGLRGTKVMLSPPVFANIKGARLRIGILPLEKSESRNEKLLAQFVLDKITEDWGGVHVRYNSFRMMPYGDSGDDWLRLDADRGRRLGKPSEDSLFDFATKLGLSDPGRSLLNLLGMRNYFGHVEVSSAMTGLTPRIDRQGFVDTAAFDQLRRFVRFAIDWATIQREHYIQNRIDVSVKKAREALRPVLNLEVPRAQLVPKATAYLRTEIKRIVDTLPQREQQATGDTLLRTIKVIEASSKEDTKTLEHLRLVASASTLTFLFAHEVRTVLGTLSATAKRLKQLAQTATGSEAKGLLDLSANISGSKTRLEALVDMTGVVGVLSQKNELQDLNLKNAIKSAVQCFELVQKSYAIEVDYTSVPNRLMVGPILEGEIYTVFINLLSNSIKSVIAASPQKRRIKIEATEMGKSVMVRVMDNGLGLPEQYQEDVFTPFISDPSGTLYAKLGKKANPEDAHVFGAGSGLGLSIVRDILNARKGAIRFVVPSDEWKCAIEIKLP